MQRIIKFFNQLFCRKLLQLPKYNQATLLYNFQLLKFIKLSKLNATRQIKLQNASAGYFF